MGALCQQEQGPAAAEAAPAAVPSPSKPMGGMMQRLRSSLELRRSSQVVDQVLEEALRQPTAMARLQHLTERLVQARLVDFACVSLVSNLSAFALLAIHGPGSELFPPPLSPCEPAACTNCKGRCTAGQPSPERTSKLSAAADMTCSCTEAPTRLASQQPRRSFSLFHSRRLFQLEGSGWSLQDVTASATPWYYDCSHQNVHGQPREAAWLNCAGLRSMVCLPCIHERRVCGAMLLASHNTSWDSTLLRKLQDLVYHATPFVVQAGVDLAPCLSALQAQRFKSSNEIAAGMMFEMVHLDKILLARITHNINTSTTATSNGTPATSSLPTIVIGDESSTTAATADVGRQGATKPSAVQEAVQVQAVCRPLQQVLTPAAAAAAGAGASIKPARSSAATAAGSNSRTSATAISLGYLPPLPPTKQAYLQQMRDSLAAQQQQARQQQQQPAAVVASASHVLSAMPQTSSPAFVQRASHGRVCTTAPVVPPMDEQARVYQQQHGTHARQQQQVVVPVTSGNGSDEDAFNPQSSTSSSRSSRTGTCPHDVVPVLVSAPSPPTDATNCGSGGGYSNSTASEHVTPCGMISGHDVVLTAKLRVWEEEMSGYCRSLDALSTHNNNAHNSIPASVQRQQQQAMHDGGNGGGRHTDEGLHAGSFMHGRGSAYQGLCEGVISEDYVSRLKGSAAYQAAAMEQMQAELLQQEQQEQLQLQQEAEALLLEGDGGSGSASSGGSGRGSGHSQQGSKGASAVFMMDHEGLAGGTHLDRDSFILGEEQHQQLLEACSYAPHHHGHGFGAASAAGGNHAHAHATACERRESSTTLSCMSGCGGGVRTSGLGLGGLGAGSGWSETPDYTLSCGYGSQYMGNGAGSAALLMTQSTGRPSFHHQNMGIMGSTNWPDSTRSSATPSGGNGAHSRRSSLHAPSAIAAAAAAALGLAGYNSSRLSLNSRGSLTTAVAPLASVGADGSGGNAAGVCLAASSSLYSTSPGMHGKANSGTSSGAANGCGGHNANSSSMAAGAAGTMASGLGMASHMGMHDRRNLPTLDEGLESR